MSCHSLLTGWEGTALRSGLALAFLVGVRHLIAAPPVSLPIDAAYDRIDSAAWAHRAPRSLVLEATIAAGRSLISATESVVIAPDGTRRLRLESRALEADRVELGSVFVETQGRTWKLHAGYRTPCGRQPQLWEQFPLRFRDAHGRNVPPSALTATRTEALGAEDRPCTLIQIRRRHRPTGMLPPGSPSGDPTLLPAMEYRYTIDSATGLLTGWTAFDESGAVLASLEYARVRIVDLPDASFDLPPPLSSRLEFSRTHFLVEGRPDATEARAQFLCRNRDTRPLAIKQVTASCSCVTVDAFPPVIPPGATAALSATFHYGNREGRQLQTLTVQTDEAGVEPTVLAFEVHIPVAAILEPRVHYWRATAPRATRTATVRFREAAGFQFLDATTEHDRFLIGVAPETAPGVATLEITPRPGMEGTRDTLIVRIFTPGGRVVCYRSLLHGPPRPDPTPTT